MSLGSLHSALTAKSGQCACCTRRDAAANTHGGTQLTVCKLCCVSCRWCRLLCCRVPVNIETQLHLAQQVAAGLSHLHSLGIVHRDLAARNILVRTGSGCHVLVCVCPTVTIAPPGGRPLSCLHLRLWLRPSAARSRIRGHSQRRRSHSLDGARVHARPLQRRE